MTLKDDLTAYRARWQAVVELELQERKTASYELRWLQLNSIINLAVKLGLLNKPDPSEEGVYQRWAWLKEKADDQNQ